jgi:hypothetical protein
MKIAPVIGMLMAGFPTRLRWLVGILCGITGVPALLIALFKTHANDSMGAAVIFGIDIWMAWGLFAHGSRVLLGDTRVLRIPGVARAWSATLLLFLLPSVLLPAVFFGPYLNSFGEILPGFLCAAAAGMLLVAPLEVVLLFPRVTFFFLMVGAALMMLQDYLPTAAFTSALQEHPMPTEPMALWALSAILCGLTYWRWRVLVLHADGKFPTLQAAFAANMASRNHGVDFGRIASAGQDWRIVAMRYWLGGPVAPMYWQALAVNFCGIALLSGLVALWAHMAVAALLVPFGIAVLSLMQYPQPWGKRYAMRGGDMADRAELALLPGWGDRTNTQRTLLVAVFRPLVTRLVGVVAMIETLGYLFHVGSTTQWSLACSMVIAGSAAAVNCLDVLAHRPPAFLFNGYFFCIVVALLTVSLYSCICIGSQGVDLPTWFVLTAIHCGAMALLARSAYADFRRQPHPFLME